MTRSFMLVLAYSAVAATLIACGGSPSTTLTPVKTPVVAATPASAG